MWERWNLAGVDDFQITLVNNHHIDKSHENESLAGNITHIRTDVLELKVDFFLNFDVIFSNSMFEHLSTFQEQMSLALMVRRCGKPYFIQVPNRRCIVDSHFPHPFALYFGMIHKTFEARLLSWHALGSGERSSSYEAAMRRLKYYTPIDQYTLQRLFPRATVATEFHLGLPLSLIATGRDDAGVGGAS